MEISPRVLRERSNQLLDKLRQNQALMKQEQKLSHPTPISPVSTQPRPRKPKSITPVQAKQKLLEKRKRTFTSTPVSTPVKNTRQLGHRTPQSILKKRKLIDRNVKVDSKLPDNTLDLTPEQSQSQYLNFSYDASSVKSPYNTRHGSGKKTTSSPRTSFIDKSPVKKKMKPDSTILLKDEGNSRSAANYEKDKTRRSAYIAPVENTKKNTNRVTFNESLSKTYSTLYDNQREQVPAPMLGYDWIAGALDNSKPSALDKSDAYFDDILTFRKQNREMCVARQPAEEGTDEDGSELDSVGASTLLSYNDHTCIHTYVVNERLFTQPLNKMANGQSACPVCHKGKKDPTSTSPGFVRISLPARSLEDGYTVVPHRRRSFDPSDSCALSQHCMAGMQSSKPSSFKPATTLDMRSAVPKGAKSKFAVDSDVDKIIREEKFHYQTPSRITRSRVAALDLKAEHRQHNLQGQVQDGSTKYGKKKTSNRSVANRVNLSRKTHDLLDTSHSLRYHAQRLERSAHAQPAGNTTRFPAGV